MKIIFHVFFAITCCFLVAQVWCVGQDLIRDELEADFDSSDDSTWDDDVLLSGAEEESPGVFTVRLKKTSATAQHLHHLSVYQKRNAGAEPISKTNFPLLGDVNRFGIFYIEVGVGTPPRNFKVIFDTGGWNFLLINRNCTGCGEVRHYRPSLSSTQRRLRCDELRTCRCSKSNMCLSHHHFGGGQDFIAQVYEETVHFASLDTKALLSAIKVKTSNKFAFPPGIDGLMGFGYYSPSAHPTVFQRLVKSGKVRDIFSTCLGANGGVLTLGGVDPRLYRKDYPIQYTPLEKKRWYVIHVEDMTVGGRSLNLPPAAYAQRHSIVDSGTTFLYVPQAAFSRIIDMMSAQCKTNFLPGICDGRLDDLLRCGKGIKMTLEERLRFPNITVNLANNVVLNVHPNLYVYPTEPIVLNGNRGHGKFCLSVQEARDKKEVVIGSIVLQDYYTIYDRENQRIGFAPVHNCF